MTRIWKNTNDLLDCAVSKVEELTKSFFNETKIAILSPYEEEPTTEKVSEYGKEYEIKTITEILREHFSDYDIKSTLYVEGILDSIVTYSRGPCDIEYKRHLVWKLTVTEKQ